MHIPQVSSESRDGQGGDTFREFADTFKRTMFCFLFCFGLVNFCLFVVLFLFCFPFSPTDSSPRDHGNHSQLHVSLWNFQQPDGAPRGGSPSGMHRLWSVCTTERVIPSNSQRDQCKESPLDWEKWINPSFLVVNKAPITCSMGKRKCWGFQVSSDPCPRIIPGHWFVLKFGNFQELLTTLWWRIFVAPQSVLGSWSSPHHQTMIRDRL